MFCINCFHKNTTVVNSRSQKKVPQVWRRRKCAKCGTIFTTRERPSLTDNKPVLFPSGRQEIFNLGKLILSIAKAYTHNPQEAEENSFWLAQRVEETLSTEYEVITPEEIEAITHNVLKHFDELAAMQYAAQHRLISSVRRRGRPSLSWREPKIGE